MESNDYPPQPSRSFTEYLVFVVLLIPTFIVLGAALVSLAAPDPSVEVQPVLTAAACDPCPRQDEDYLP